MSFRSKAFKELRNEWYEKLKEAGFEDIEDTKSSPERLKRWDSSYFSDKRITKIMRDSQEQYYYEATHLLVTHKEVFTPITHKVWELHSNGYSCRNIADELSQNGIKTNKDMINKTINKIKKLIYG
jgi:tRNA G26 N,N-dimethylase Trm1